MTGGDSLRPIRVKCPSSGEARPPRRHPEILKSALAEGNMMATMRRSTLVRCALPVLMMVNGPGVGVARGESPRFSTVAPGIAHSTFEVPVDGADPFAGHAFKIDLDVADLRLFPAGGPSSRRTVRQMVAAYPAVVAINASFFDTEGRAMGLAVDEGRSTGGGRRPSWGALVVEGKKARITLGADMGAPPAPHLIVQGIPRLVVGGKVLGLKPQFAERSAVCAQGNVVTLVVSTKAEANAFARFLAASPEKGGLGCVDALNLDGGPSTQLVAKLPGLELSLPGGWGVPNALVVTPGR
jgi:phosphodiester glycosidase